MAINTTTFESTLQTKLDDTTLAAKDMLLLGKALEATTGNIAVSDVATAGATQVTAVNNAGTTKVNEINTAATNTFKTVGGASILGTGDIAALPAGGTVGQVVTNTGSGAGGWADAAGGGKILQVISNPSSVGTAWDAGSSWGTLSDASVTITPSSTSSRVFVQFHHTAFIAANAGGLGYRILRNGVAVNGAGTWQQGYNTGGGEWSSEMLNAIWVDSPNTTSSVTYTIQIIALAGTWRFHETSGANTQQTIAMEIGA